MIWSYHPHLHLRLYRRTTWGDRRHWELTIGRMLIYRWCPGAPCHLPGVSGRHHWVRVRLWRRAGSARLDT